MERTIVGFDSDEEGQWRVLLDCGHRRHLRHDPPRESRPELQDKAYREAAVGGKIECGLCAQREIPDGAKVYKSTPLFSAETVPDVGPIGGAEGGRRAARSGASLDRFTPSRCGNTGYGLIGCGRFGEFCLRSLASREDVHPRRVADLDAEQARSLGNRFGVAGGTVDELMDDNDVDLIHVATPPSTHHALAARALDRGKHVLIEKPFCLTLEDADDLLRRAAEAGRRLAVNHLLRYNPLVERVGQIVRSGLLGRPLRAWLENYASDESLGDDHWFWDRSQSGGIFVEHATHFFDLQSWWLGAGVVVGAQTMSRGDKVDRVASQSVHGEVLVSQYHGFDQATRMDRAEHRIVCEHGEMRLFGWIPLRLEAEGLFEALPSGFAGVESFAGPDQAYRARGLNRSCAVRGRLEVAAGMAKSDLYAQQFGDLVSDQMGSQRPRLTADDAREALRMALEATEMAEDLLKNR